MFGKEEKVVMVRGNSMLYQKLFIASWHLIPIAFYGKEQTNEQIFVLLKERKIDFVLLTLRSRFHPTFLFNYNELLPRH